MWRFSSLPISLHHVNEVIGCDVVTQSHVRVVDLVLCQDTLNSFTVQLGLCTLTSEGEKERGTDRGQVSSRMTGRQ